jgi:hypothetical protein
MELAVWDVHAERRAATTLLAFHISFPGVKAREGTQDRPHFAVALRLFVKKQTQQRPLGWQRVITSAW